MLAKSAGRSGGVRTEPALPRAQPGVPTTTRTGWRPRAAAMSSTTSRAARYRGSNVPLAGSRRSQPTSKRTLVRPLNRARSRSRAALAASNHSRCVLTQKRGGPSTRTARRNDTGEAESRPTMRTSSSCGPGGASVSRSSTARQPELANRDPKALAMSGRSNPICASATWAPSRYSPTRSTPPPSAESTAQPSTCSTPRTCASPDG